MRITYVHQHFKRPDEAGGSRPWENARKLAEAGHDVTIVAGGSSNRAYGESGFRVEEIRAPYKNEMTYIERVRSFLRFVVGSTRVTLRTPADLVIASSTPLTVAIPALLRKTTQGTPYIFEVRDLWPSVPIELGILRNPFLIRAALWLEYVAYRNASHIVALSPGMAAGVLQKSPKSAVTIIPNAADIDRFMLQHEEQVELREEFGWTDDFVLVYAGSFGWTYDLEYLVRVAAHLQDSHIRLVLYGEGASTVALQTLADELGLDSARLMPGILPKAEVAKRIAAADGVISSIRNIAPLHVNSLNKVFDGLAAGKPIIFTHDGWLKEVVTSAGAGFKMLREDPKQAAAQLQDFARDASAREDMARRAAILARTEFDRDLLFTQLHALVSSLDPAMADTKPARP